MEIRYGLDIPGIESRLGRDLLQVSRPAQGHIHPRVQRVEYRISFPGVKRPGRSVDHPLQSSAELKERVHLYHNSPSEPSQPVLG